MIDTKDLMIGNWVIDKEDNAPIEVKFLNSVMKCIGNKERMMFGLPVPTTIYCNNLDSIPVTPELLERIGFERFFVCDTMFYRYWGEGYKLDVDYGEEGNFGPDRLWHVHIDNQDCSTIGNGYFASLHDLQNLVRAINGHDLPITKEMLG